MRGWFSSTSIGVGYYDFAPFGDGVQGEELKFSIGGGYTWALSEWWRMTAELGVGPILTQYRVYTAEAPDRLVVTDEQARVFWGITNAKFSLSYLFHTRPRGR